MSFNRILAGTGTLTLSILMLELSLTRLFSATLYYHLAFLAISIALLGSGSSGIFIYLIQNRIAPERTGRWLCVFSLLFSVGALAALFVILQNPLLMSDRDDSLTLFSKLSLIYVVTFLPFFFAGCAVTLIIFRYAKQISRVYLFDLAGAAIGCVLLIPVINAIGAVNAVIAIAAVGAVASFLFGVSDKNERAAPAAAALAVLLAAAAVANSVYGLFDLQGGKWAEQEDVVFSKWNSFSRITVTGDPDRRDLQLKIDSDAATRIMPDAANLALHQDRKKDISSVAYHLKPGADAAIIGAGGAQDVSTALVLGARKIAAVEINPIIARDVMSAEPFKSYTGDIYADPRVELVVDEGRSFIRRSDQAHDVIQATMVDTWAATAAGAFSLSENNLYTVEAFSDYLAHLKPNGILTMTRWYFEPPDQILRLSTISLEAMNRLGVPDPENRIIILKESGNAGSHVPATFLLKNGAFDEAEIAAVRNLAEQNGFEILYLPRSQIRNVFADVIAAKDPQQAWASFETNIAPTYDNNPFFFNSLKISHLGFWSKGAIEWRKTNLGTIVLFLLAAITSVLVAAFIVLPFFIRIGREGATAGRGRFLTYFACLGGAFIIVEVAMIQKFILFLGHPVYSLAVTLFSILIFCAVGSRLTGLIPEAKLKSSLVLVIAAILGLACLYVLFLTDIFYAYISAPITGRIAISVIVLAPLSLMMGMPMPIGIRLLEKHAPQIIPWAWGLNGATSVLGSAATLVIAILTGFNQALMVGAFVYLIALIVMVLRPGESADAPSLQ